MSYELSPLTPRSRTSRVVLTLTGTLVMAFLLLPVFAVVPMSFNDGARFEIVPSNPSLVQYRAFFADDRWTDALRLSILLALAVTGLALVLGTLGALGLARLGSKRRSLLEAVFVSPQIVPSIVIAASSYFVFVDLGLVGTPVGIGLVHTLLAMPFVILIVGSRLQSMSAELVEASASLGAGPLTTFRRVTLPQISTALLGSALLAFHASFDEVVLALFLSGARNKTLPVRLWDSILFEVTPSLPAISTIVLVIPLCIALLVWSVNAAIRRRVSMSPPTLFRAELHSTD